MATKMVLACSDCGSRNYSTQGNANGEKRLEIKKYCSACSKHTVHKQTK